MSSARNDGEVLNGPSSLTMLDNIVRQLDIAYHLPPTDIKMTIAIFCAIAIITFFARNSYLLFFILLFIYLLPRAGIIMPEGLLSFPLPLGYIFIFFLMVKWLGLLSYTKFTIRKKSPIDRIFLFYIAIVIMAVLTGLINGANIKVMTFEVLLYFAAFFVFFMALDIFDSERCVRVFMKGLLVCGFLVALYGIVLLISGKALLIDYVTYTAGTYIALIEQFLLAKRTISSYGDPNTLSSQLMLFCSIFASTLLLGRHRFFQRLFLFIGLVLTVVCIYFASSRTSLLGLFILFLVLALVKIKVLWVYIPIIIVNYLFFLEPIRKYYEHRLFSHGIPHTDVRILYIKVFFDLLVRYPFGVGFGVSIDERTYEIVKPINIWHGFNSFYLHIFSRIGIQGVVAFALMLFFIVKYLFDGYKKIKDVNVRAFVFGGACGLIIQQINFLTNNVYHVPGGMLNFWIMCAMLVTIVNVYKEDKGQDTALSFSRS